jgi:osmotically-inducible protein OsmY
MAEAISPSNAMTDKELEQVLMENLRHQIPAIRRVRVHVHDGTVRICGRVQSFYERQLCLTSCQRHAGVRPVIDEIEVTLSAGNFFPSQLDPSASPS